MRRAALIALAVALLLAGPASAAEPEASLPDIEDEVMCVECGTALNISQSPAADGERRFIRRRIADGMTKKQIKDALVAEYGRNVLASPSSKGFNAAVYLVPIALALLALLALLFTAKRWRRAGAEDTAQQDPGPKLADEDAKRLERDMAGYDL
jgi:cytochrome c-type biogenesis protein CcmH